ncbi:MAG: LysE family translocator [Candidatus Thorarchaeota archaeon]|nr:LysE family translocator [Candidatus Thorarchaeota archaeon]
MGVFEILAAWFALSLTGALAPGPLTAAVVMQSSKYGRLHGILPMVGHAIVEVGIIAAIIISVQALTLTPLMIDLLVGFGGIVIILFGFLALRDYRYREEMRSKDATNMTASSVIEATTQGAAVSILSPYFLLWWFGVGLANVTVLVGTLQIGVGTVFLAGVLIYITHVSTDFIYGAVLTLGTDVATKKASVGDINWVSVVIGFVQIGLGIWFVILAAPGLIALIG